MEPNLPTGAERAVFLERYELHEPLGSGAASTVYCARDRQLSGEVVALKLLHRHLEHTDALAQRFQQEMQLLQSLSHPNIVRVFDFGRTEQGSPVIVMEYLEGETLDRTLQNGAALPPREVFRILESVLSALEAMHDAGIVHRDIKPANLHRGISGVIKVLDLGVSKSLKHSGELTQQCDAIGTPRYMSPEQLHNTEVDPRSDIYAVGLLAYELASGVPFFKEESLVGIAAAQQVGPERISEVEELSSYPKIFHDFISRCLARTPAERFSSAAECRAHLAEAARVVGRSYGTSAAARCRRAMGVYRTPIICALLGIALLLSALASLRLDPRTQGTALALVLRIERNFSVNLKPVKWILGYPEVEATEQFLARLLRAKNDRRPGWVEDKEFGKPKWFFLLNVLLDAGVDPNGKDEEGLPFLYHSFSMVSGANLMINYGADPCIPFPHGTALTSALIRSGPAALIIQHMSENCPELLPAKEAKFGNTALHLLALFQGSVETSVVEQFVAVEPALLESRNNESLTPLMVSITSPELSLMTALAATGADLEARDQSGHTSLMLAILLGKEEPITQLLRLGADVRTTAGSDEKTVLHYAALVGPGRSIDILVAAGAPVNRVDRTGAAALHDAVLADQPEVVERLLAAGAEIDIADIDHNTPLAVGVLHGKANLVARLLDAGADPNAANSGRRTALHLAAFKPDERVADLLLAAGADPTLRDADGLLPSEVARKKGHAEFGALLEQAEERYRQQHAALRNAPERRIEDALQRRHARKQGAR